MLSFTLKK